MKQYSFKINGKAYDVQIESIENGTAHVSVNGVPYDVELPADAPAAPAAQAAPAAAAPAPAPAPQGSAPVPQAPAAPSGKATDIVSPRPGVIIDVNVREGAAVKRGQKVAVLEAMKMENDILAERDGTVTAIHVSKGDSVLEGAKIVSIA